MADGPGIAVGLVAGEPLAAFRFVALDSTGKLRQACGAADELVVGVSEGPAEVAQGVAVTFVGVSKVETATRIGAGGPVSSDGEGRGAAWIDSLSPVLAIALSDSGGSGEIIRVLVFARPVPILERELLRIDPNRFQVPV